MFYFSPAEMSNWHWETRAQLAFPFSAVFRRHDQWRWVLITMAVFAPTPRSRAMIPPAIAHAWPPLRGVCTTSPHSRFSQYAFLTGINKHAIHVHGYAVVFIRRANLRPQGARHNAKHCATVKAKFGVGNDLHTVIAKLHFELLPNCYLFAKLFLLLGSLGFRCVGILRRLDRLRLSGLFRTRGESWRHALRLRLIRRLYRIDCGYGDM